MRQQTYGVCTCALFGEVCRCPAPRSLRGHVVAMGEKKNFTQRSTIHVTTRQATYNLTLTHVGAATFALE